ncbi:MAG: alpha/beta fold hydrolase [Bacteroidales bacterium]
MIRMAIFCLLLAVAAIVIFMVIVSPGKPRSCPATDSGRSICEKRFADIGGVRQGMFIRSVDTTNPVLLFVHGGPSFSEYFLVEKYPTRLEEYFTVCYWDQRGGGLSATPEVTMESLTLAQLADDMIEVTNYLRSRFGQEKIYIMAHSGGTAFAIRAVAENPELYHAYIGMAQITRQAESEKLAYRYMVDMYSSSGNTKAAAKFREYPIHEDEAYLLPFFNSVLRDKSMHELGIGTMRNMNSIMTGVFYPVWLCRAYTLKEKFYIWRSKFSFVNKSGLRAEVLALDMMKEVPSLEVPVYFFSGRHDMTVNRDLSEDYYNELECPLKRFYTFENSAHSPMFEETERFLEIMITDVLNGIAYQRFSRFPD